MIRSALPLLLLVMLLSASTAAHGWMRLRYEDAIVVERSELIVVGRLNGESIREVPHERRPEEGQSWEYHATLTITEVLKGKAPGEEIPIVIHYGLTPTRLTVQYGLDPDSPREELGSIAMYDSGNSAVSFEPLIEDVETENLWFLRRRSGLYGREPGTGNYGVVDPEDVQPLLWEDYFLTYLSTDPERAVAEYAQRNPQMSYRAKSYLDHLEVQRILGLKDAKERCEKLLPFFLNRTSWGNEWEAKTGLLQCGPLAGASLKEVFLDPKHRENRQEILRLWSDMRYKEIVPFLIKLLEKHNRSPQAKRLEKEGLNSDGSEKARRGADTIAEVLYSVRALNEFQDPRSKVVLEATCVRWKAIKPGGQIVEECEEALRALSQRTEADTREMGSIPP